MGFSRQEYWSGLPFPPPGDLPNPRNPPEPGIEPKAPALTGGLFPTGQQGKPSTKYTDISEVTGIDG